METEQAEFERNLCEAICAAPPEFFSKIKAAFDNPLYPHHNDAVVGKLMRDLMTNRRGSIDG